MVTKDAGQSVVMSILLAMAAISLIGYFAQGPNPDYDKVSEKKSGG